jgi:hypothetical protein
MAKKNGHKAEAKVAATETVKAEEKKETKKATTKGKPTAAEEKATGKNAYGHTLGKQSAQLDELLERGGTLESMAKAIGSSEGRVKSHVKHLREDLEVTVTEKEGVYRIAPKR